MKQRSPTLADVVHPAEVEHQGMSRIHQGQMRPEGRLERLGAGVIDAPPRAQDDRVAVAGAREFHRWGRRTKAWPCAGAA